MLEAKIISALNESRKVVLETEEQDVTEAIRKVRGGKVVKLKKAPKKGYKVIDGKYVKMSSKEIAARRKAIKKAQRKSHTGAAKLARRKSMKLRLRKGLNDCFKFDEQAFQHLMNASLDNIFESASNEFYSFTVESVNSATFKDSNLVLECSIGYADGVTASGTFTIDDFDYTSGTESSNLLDEIKGSMSVDLVVENGAVIPEKFGHDVVVSGEQISEAFVFESLKIEKDTDFGLPSGADALKADVDGVWELSVSYDEEDDSIAIWLDSEDGAYVLVYGADEEADAVAKFKEIAKYINPDSFDPEEVADEFEMEEC